MYLILVRKPHHLCVGVGAAAMRDQVRVILILIREAVAAKAPNLNDTTLSQGRSACKKRLADAERCDMSLLHLRRCFAWYTNGLHPHTSGYVMQTCIRCMYAHTERCTPAHEEHMLKVMTEALHTMTLHQMHRVTGAWTLNTVYHL